MLVTIRYPTFDEQLPAVPMGRGVARLVAYSQHIPLAPDDVIRHHRGVVTGIVTLTDHFIVEAYLRLNCSQSLMDRKLDEWGRATDVQQSSACTVLVRSLSRQWMDDTVIVDPDVEMARVLRVPTQILNLRDEVNRT